MKKNLAKFVLTVYVLSTAIFYAVIPKAEMGEGLAAVFAEKKTEMNPTNFGIMCISAVYPNIDIKPVKAQSGTQEGGITQAGIGQTGTQESRTKGTGKESGSTEKPDVEVVVNDSDKDTKPRVFGKDPVVLIVHTHASEAYTPEPGFTYEPSDTLRTQDETRSVIRLGSEIARILEDAGIETLHDTTHNDYPSYDGSYARMQTIIESYLAQYPSIQMVLDVHRDAVEDRAGFPAALTAKIDGEEYARLMLVVGTDEGGLTHPRWQENLANALKLQALVNRSAPGLCRDIDLRTERFNQHETDGSLLCEFGASGNTLSQALRTARVFADVLVSFINGVAAAS